MWLHQKPSDHRFKDGGLYLAHQQHLSRSTVSSTENKTRSSGGNQGYGRLAGPTVYRMLRYGMQFVDRGAVFYEAQNRTLQINSLERKAAKLGFQIIEAPAP